MSAAIIGSTAAAAVLASLVRSESLAALDDGVLRWLDRIAHPVLDVIALEITALGETLVLLVIAAVAATFLSSMGHARAPRLLVGGVVGIALLVPLLKWVVGRPRPDLFEWRAPHGGLPESFPSGHAASTFFLFGTLAYILGRLDVRPGVRRTGYAAVALIVFLVGLSRAYIGVHYPTDVLGGYLIGLAWTVTCIRLSGWDRGTDGRRG